MTKQSILRTLKAALALLEAGWCQGAYAKDAKGNVVQVNNKYATQFDILGALHRCCGKSQLWDENIFNYFPKSLQDNPGKWNDNPKRTHAQVTKALRNAISKLEADDEG